jgi:ferritin-like metal-binding protein YciE
MGIFTKDIKTMEDLFLHQLQDIYYAEQQLTKAIPKMAELATRRWRDARSRRRRRFEQGRLEPVSRARILRIERTARPVGHSHTACI